MCIKGRRSKLDIQNTQFYFRKLNKTVFINYVNFKKVYVCQQMEPNKGTKTCMTEQLQALSPIELSSLTLFDVNIDHYNGN